MRAADLGLPTSHAGCKAGRWQLAEGWASPGAKGIKGVAVHPLPLEAVLSAIDSAATQARPAAPQPAAPALSLTLRLTPTLTLTLTSALIPLPTPTPALALTPTPTLTRTPHPHPHPHPRPITPTLRPQAARRGGRDSKAPPLCSRAEATAAFEDAHARANYSSSVEAEDYKLVELSDVYLDGKHPSSLYQASQVIAPLLPPPPRTEAHPSEPHAPA